MAKAQPYTAEFVISVIDEQLVDVNLDSVTASGVGLEWYAQGEVQMDGRRQWLTASLIGAELEIDFTDPVSVDPFEGLV